MRLSFHVLMAESLLPDLIKWQNSCKEMGFDLEFAPAAILSSKTVSIYLIHHGIQTGFKIYLSPMSDVADICDELRDHINEDQNISVNVDFDGDPIEMQWVIAAVSVLTKITDGVLYVEGDGVFFSGDQAIENARGFGIS